MPENKIKVSRKPEESKKTIKRTARFTPAENQLVNRLMAAVPTKNFSEFVRIKLFNAQSKKQISETSRLIFELNKAGTNFNQIVKTFNTFSKKSNNTLWLNDQHKLVITKVIETIELLNKEIIK